MAENGNDRLQELFLAALAVSADQRESWLVQQCGDNTQLLTNVRELLANDDRSHDPLEQGLDAVQGEFPSTLIPGLTADRAGSEAGSKTDEQNAAVVVDSQLFLSKLTDVGVLSADELDELSATLEAEQNDSDPRKLASQLVSEGKLTEYQAAALLNGKPDLLLDKYLILDLIGAGAMGMVFKAIHRPMNRTVAIKMISQHLLSSPEQVKRFQREVRVAATLEHPHIVRAYDADQANGVHFLVLEYVRGETLAQIVRRDGPLSLEAAVAAIVQAGQGLGYAHEQGIIHRDVKPANLMRNTRGVVKVLDLGLADVDESLSLVQQSSAAIPGRDQAVFEPTASELTHAGTVLGTVSYMAPEQSVNAASADARSDIYALGCTLYSLLIGEPPYKGDSIFEVFAQHRDAEIPTLRANRPDVPVEVDAICRRMLAKAPEDRYQSMQEMIVAFQACGLFPSIDTPRSTSEDDPRVRRAAADTGSVKQAGRRRNGWTGILLIFVLIGGIYALPLLFGPSAERHQAGRAEVVRVSERAESTLLDGQHDSPTATSSDSPDGPQFALAFDGKANHVELPRMGFVGKQSVTLEVWYETDQLIRSNGACLVMLDGCLWIESTKEGTWRVAARAEDGGHYRGNCSEKQIVGRPVHVAAIFVDSRFRLFIDGKEMPLKHVRLFNDGKTYQLVPVLGKLTVARSHTDQNSALGRHAASRSQPTFQGRLYGVRLSLGARYTGDFTPPTTFDVDDETFALFHFDEGQGDVLHDSSGHRHHGTIVGASWVQVDNPITNFETTSTTP